MEEALVILEARRLLDGSGIRQRVWQLCRTTHPMAKSVIN